MFQEEFDAMDDAAADEVYRLAVQRLTSARRRNADRLVAHSVLSPR